MDFGNTLHTDFTTWSWLGLHDAASAPSSLQQNYAEMPPVPTTSTSTVDASFLNPMAQPFEQNTTVYQPIVQDRFTSCNSQAQVNERGPTDRIEELMSMFADFQAKTEQRMTLIEKEMQAVKSR